MTDPYLNLFRNLIPPLMGQIDFTPIFGFMVLQFLVQVLGAVPPAPSLPAGASPPQWQPAELWCGLHVCRGLCMLPLGCLVLDKFP